MIIKFHDDFFIQWDYILLDAPYPQGTLNFCINGKFYPNEVGYYTMSSLLYSLTSNIEEIRNLTIDIGDTPIDEIDFVNCEDDRLIWLDTDELYQQGFGLVLGYNGDQERILITIDYEKSFNEIVLPKGTLLKTLEALENVRLSLYGSVQKPV